jgi:Na+-transporting NADH:ubiquinone oxidoreductase subunit A
MDTNPLAGDPTVCINQEKQAFIDGLNVLSNLTEGKLFVCKAGDAEVDTGDADVTVESFSGPHPAGLVGTHIHFLQPASLKRPVWHIGYQDVIAYGKLFTTGEIFTDRVVSLAGEGVKEPRLVRTRMGANLHELTDGEITSDNQRVISGSVLFGHTADNEHAWLGRFHNQVSVIPEGNNKEFLGWIRPGSDLHSIT